MKLDFISSSFGQEEVLTPDYNGALAEGLHAITISTSLCERIVAYGICAGRVSPDILK